MYFLVTNIALSENSIGTKGNLSHRCSSYRDSTVYL